MIKKTLSITVLLSALMVLVFALPAFADSVNVNVKGEKVNFPDQKPFVDTDTNRTYVPLRFVSNALGAKTAWDGSTQTATVTGSGKKIKITIGSKSPEINEKEKSLDAPAKMKNGRTVVPLRFMSEAMGLNVNWDAKTSTINIVPSGSKEKHNAPDTPKVPTETPENSKTTTSKVTKEELESVLGKKIKPGNEKYPAGCLVTDYLQVDVLEGGIAVTLWKESKNGKIDKSGKSVKKSKEIIDLYFTENSEKIKDELEKAVNNSHRNGETGVVWSGKSSGGEKYIQIKSFGNESEGLAGYVIDGINTSGYKN